MAKSRSFFAERTGGLISYTYASMEDCSSSAQYKRMVTTRTVTDGIGGSWSWQYSYQNPIRQDR